MGWTARQIFRDGRERPFAGVDYPRTFQEMMSGSGAAPDFGTKFIGCVGQTGLPADGLESRE